MPPLAVTQRGVSLPSLGSAGFTAPSWKGAVAGNRGACRGAGTIQLTFPCS